MMLKVSPHIENVSFSTFQQRSPIPALCSFPPISRSAGGGSVSATALPESKMSDSIAIPVTILVLLHLILIENMSDPIFIIFFLFCVFCALMQNAFRLEIYEDGLFFIIHGFIHGRKCGSSLIVARHSSRDKSSYS